MLEIWYWNIFWLSFFLIFKLKILTFFLTFIKRFGRNDGMIYYSTLPKEYSMIIRTLLIKGVAMKILNSIIWWTELRYGIVAIYVKSFFHFQNPAFIFYFTNLLLSNFIWAHLIFNFSLIQFEYCLFELFFI